jgi:hypothetical protein
MVKSMNTLETHPIHTQWCGLGVPKKSIPIIFGKWVWLWCGFGVRAVCLFFFGCSFIANRYLNRICISRSSSMESSEINSAINKLKKELAELDADSKNGWTGWVNQLNRRLDNPEVGLESLFGAVAMEIEAKKIQLQSLEIQKNIEAKKQQESHDE